MVLVENSLLLIVRFGINEQANECGLRIPEFFF